MECILNCQILVNPDGICPGLCFNKCPDVCRILLVDDADIYQSIPLPPLPPPPPPPFYARESSDRTNHKHVISTTMSVGASLLGTVLLLGVFCIVSRAYRRRQGNQRRREAGIAPTQEVFWDENQGPELDHPIWHIRTEGLHQSVIDAIAVFEYKKGEGLAEGTDCSVCLNEFEDDETLRLLPKCSHAFHLPCIDTWLRSHKNCPVCRAPVVKVNFDGGADSSVPVASDLSSREAEIGNSAAGSSGSVGDLEGQDGALEVRIGDGNVLLSEEETNSGTGSSKLSGHVRVRSDLTEHREDVEASIQPMRRSVSLDSFSAVAIYAAVSQAVHGKQPGNLDSTKQSKRSRAENLNKRGTTGSLSFRKLMTSSLIGKSLQMGPISMKRSISSSGKSSLSASSLGDSGRRDPILPLRSQEEQR